MLEAFMLMMCGSIIMLVGVVIGFGIANYESENED